MEILEYISGIVTAIFCSIIANAIDRYIQRRKNDKSRHRPK